MVEGFKAPEQALGFISSENVLKSQTVPLFKLWEGLTSPDCGTAHARGRKRQGGGECYPEPQELTGLGRMVSVIRFELCPDGCHVHFVHPQ